MREDSQVGPRPASPPENNDQQRTPLAAAVAVRLQEACLGLVDIEDPAILLQAISDALVELAGAAVAEAWLVQPDAEQLQLLRVAGASSDASAAQWLESAREYPQLAYEVAAQGRPSHWSAEQYPDAAAALMRATRVACVRAVPFHSRTGRVLGVLATHDRAAAGDQAVAIAGTLARQAGSWIERLQAEQRLRRSAGRLHAVTRATLAVGAAPTLDRKLQAVCDQALIVVGAQHAAITVVEQGDWGRARSAVSLAEGQQAWLGLYRSTPCAGPAAEVCRANRTVRMTAPQMAVDPHWRSLAPDPVSWMGAPLLGREESNSGLLQVARPSGEAFTAEDEALLVQLTQFASAAVAAARDQHDLHDSQQRYRHIVSHTIVGVTQADAEGRITFANECWCAMLGYTQEELIGKSLTDVTDPESLKATRAALARLMAGVPALVIEKRYRRKDGSGFWATSSVHAQRDDNGDYAGLSAVVLDISERKRAERRDHFVLRLDSALRLLSDPASMLAAGCTLLREHLDADRVLYLQVDDDQSHCSVVGDYARTGVPGGTAPDRMEAFGAQVHQALREGNAVVTRDVEADPRVSGHVETFQRLHARASLAIPMHKSGRLAAVMAVQQRIPRGWQDDEVELCQLVAHRCWESIERVRIRRALVEREGRYRALVDSVDQGYCVVEMVLDAAGAPVDYRFIETNPAFVEQTGLSDAVGRTILELVPGHGQWWIDTYADIAMSGQGSRRFEAPAPAMGRWFEVYACQIDAPELLHVAILFTDITARKRQEIGRALLADINADLATLSDGQQIMRAVGDRVARQLGLSRLSFAEIDEPRDEVTVRYRSEQVPGGSPDRYRLSEFVDTGFLGPLRNGEVVLVGDVESHPLTADRAGKFIERGVRATAAVPYFSGGRWKFILLAQRHEACVWREDEVQLLREVAARTHLRLERADAETALRQSEERFVAIFEQAAGGIAYTDLEGRISLINDRYCRIVGRGREQLLAMRMEGYTHPDDVPANVAAYERMLETGRPYTIDKRYLRPNGSIVWVSSEVSLIHDPHGRPVGTIAVVQDISQRKRAEDRDRMLVALDDATLSLADPERIALAGVRVLGEHLKLDRVSYVEISGSGNEDDRDWDSVVGDYSPGMASVSGRYRLRDFGDVLLRSLRNGRPFWEDDVEHEGRGAGEIARFNELQIRAYLAVPLCKEGRLVAVIVCHQSAPRIWSNEDIERARQVANRCWESIERARVSRRLSENEERLRVALETGSLGAWQLDLASLELESNALCKAHLGLSGDTPVDYRRLIGKVIHPDDQQRVKRRIAVAVRRGAHYDLDFRATWPDGSIHWIIARGRASYGVDGQPIHLGGVTLDITERKSVEEALRISEARASQALTIARLGTWSWQPVSGAFEADERCRDICGFPDVGALTMELAAAHIHPDDRARIATALAASLDPRHGGTYNEEFRWLHQDGTVRWAVSRGQVLFDGDGPHAAAMLMLGSILDITDRKLTEQQLLDADRRKDEFLATLAHELRNPLAPIRNCLHILRMQEESQFDPSRLHEMMERQVKHLVRLVDDLMEVSRVTRGNIELRREIVDLARILQNAAETSKPLVEAGRHTLELDLPAEPLLLDADPVRLSQVFANLLNNAAKYSEPGGRILVTAAREGGQAVVSVRDQGLGIAADMLPRVFEMFAQIDQSRGYAQGGLGIGLTLVRSLVTLHGGRVDAYSEGLGHGSEFTVRLPLCVADPDDDGSSAQLRTRSGSAVHRILVVDDNRESADSLALFLRMSGHDVRVAYDGDEALACTRNARPDVILMDLGMPEPDGHQVCRLVRAKPWGEAVVIVAVTGWGQAEDRQRSEESGFDAHVVKPVDPSALMALVDSLRQMRSSSP